MSEQAPEQQAATNTATRLAALWAAWQAAQIDGPDFTRAAAIALYTGKVVASRIADIQVSTQAGAPPVGIAPGEQHVERLEEAVQAVLEEPEEASERLERLAVSETLHSHRASLHAAIREQGFESWERVVSDDPCEKCAPLAGEVQPVGTAFRDHPGCQCSLRGHGKPQTRPEIPVQISFSVT